MPKGIGSRTAFTAAKEAARAQVESLARMGFSDGRIARAVGVSKWAVTTIRLEAGIESALRARPERENATGSNLGRAESMWRALLAPRAVDHAGA